MTQYKNINEKYLAILTMMWSNAKELYKLSSNPGLELYRMQSLVFSFARQVIRIQEITERYEQAKEHKDIAELRRIKYISDRMSDEKAFAIVWDEVAEDYDSIVKAFKDETEQTVKVRNAEEILEQSRAYRKQAEELAAEDFNIDL